MQRIIIFANGDLPDINKANALLHPDDFIICADGGTRHAFALNLKPDLVIGDMDSIQKEHWQKLEETGISIELFPPDKNETDLELALNRAFELEPKEIIIIAASAGVSTRPSATLPSSAIRGTQPSRFASTMEWRKYFFAATRFKSREEAEISSHCFPGAVRSTASKRRDSNGYSTTKYSTLKKRVVLAMRC